MALLLFAVGFGPMLLATIMYYTGWMNPTEISNNGVLVQPPLAVAELQLNGADGEPLSDRFGPEVENAEWLMLVTAGSCAKECEELLYLARQVNIALGKSADRLSRAAYLEQIPADLAARWEKEYATMEQLEHQPGSSPIWPEGVVPSQTPEILLVDPFGNIMMRYNSDHSGKQMLKDLKQLMKLSQIG
ncbi:MAG: hypothetical protein WD623_03750 [Marinobacter sp.]